MTLVATYSDASTLARDVAALQGSQVELTSFDVSRSSDGRWGVLMRMASSPAATEAQAADARRLLSSTPAAVTGDEERTLWTEQIRTPWSGDGTVLRLSWLPANLLAVASLIDGLAARGCRVASFDGRVMGAGLLRLEGEERTVVSAIAALRESAIVGHVVVLRAGRGLKARLDVWGPATGALHVARALKQKFDPADILNAGRGPI
jgi:hypothetical protein